MPAANRAAVNDLVAAAERSADLDDAARAGKMVAEPDAPAFLRMVARLFFYRILKKDAFPTGFKAHKAMNPTSGPVTPAEARVRLEGALARFDPGMS